MEPSAAFSNLNLVILVIFSSFYISSIDFRYFVGYNYSHANL